MSSREFLSVSDNQSLSLFARLFLFSFSSLFLLFFLLFVAGVFKRTVNCPVTVNTIQPDEIVKNAKHFTSTDPGVGLLLKIHMNVRVSVFHCLFRDKILPNSFPFSNTCIFFSFILSVSFLVTLWSLSLVLSFLPTTNK